tara:strand:- start:4 stop:213 length:210 start_codon:yes stop_codon:yes gene_type:complete
MALSEKERLDKLLKARTSTDFYNLYEEIFGEEFPIVATLDPDEKIEMIAKAIQKNEKIKELKLAETTNI